MYPADQFLDRGKVLDNLGEGFGSGESIIFF